MSPDSPSLSCRALCDTCAVQPAISTIGTASKPSEIKTPPRESGKLPQGVDVLSASCMMISPFAPPAHRARQRAESSRGARCLRFNSRMQEMGIQAEVEDGPPPPTPPPRTPPVPGTESPGIIFSSRKSLACSGAGRGEPVWQDEEETAASSPTASSGSSYHMSPASSAPCSPRSSFSTPLVGACEPLAGPHVNDSVIRTVSLGEWVVEWRRAVHTSTLIRHAGGPFYAWHIETVTTRWDAFRDSNSQVGWF